jgi:tetratricopeptide (TPR) repeat protein
LERAWTTWLSDMRPTSLRVDAESKHHPDLADLRLRAASTPQEVDGTLRHLLGCRACQRRLLLLAAEGEQAEVEGVNDAEGAEGQLEGVISSVAAASATGRPVKRVLDRSIEIGRRREEDRRAAPALYDELIELDEASRAERVRDDPRFASPGLGELLLGAAGELVRNAPGRATELARLALEIAEQLDAVGHGEDVGMALSIAGWSRIAEALEVGEDYPGAAEALRLAEQAAEAAPIDGRERAIYCRVAARVRQGEGRLDEALGLLLRAEALCRRWGEQEELGEVLAEIGWLLAADDPTSAINALREALDLVSPEAHPWSALHIRQVLALCYLDLDLDKRREVAELLVGSLELRERLRDPLDRLHCAWTEALIGERVDSPDEALNILRIVVKDFALIGRPFDAALAAIDAAEICVLWEQRGDLDALLDQGEELPGQLPETPGVVLKMAWRLLAHREAASPIMLATVRDYLVRARRDPRRRYQPSRRPLRTLVWDRISLKDRRLICEQAGAGPETAEQTASTIAPCLRDLLGWWYLELAGTRIEWGTTDGAAA